MKKQTLLCLTLTLLGMVLLCSLAIYLKASDPSDELLAHTQKTQSEADAVIETLKKPRPNPPTLLFSSASVIPARSAWNVP